MTPAAVVCHGEIATSLELSADNDVRNGVALQHEGLSQATATARPIVLIGACAFTCSAGQVSSAKH
jgi:hypothetical protein